MNKIIINKIIEELECTEKMARKIEEISEEIENIDYQYCEKIYDISRKYNSDDYKYCKKYFEIEKVFPNADEKRVLIISKLNDNIFLENYLTIEEIEDFKIITNENNKIIFLKCLENYYLKV